MEMKIVKVVAAVIRDKDKVLATAREDGEFKGQWEFPGGKVEAGETTEQALVREIREELEVDIKVGEFIDTIEYDYSTFHLSMDCFWCELNNSKIVLKEAKWLSDLESVQWLPADLLLISKVKANLAVREMLHRKKSVEELHKSFVNKVWGEEIAKEKNVNGITKVCYSDVLYSFKSIYLMGMNAFYGNKLVDVCGLTLRPSKRENAHQKAYSKEFIEMHIDECAELNECCEIQKFISLYETKGNLIPIWPGGNAHRGLYHCYDNPDIYFNAPQMLTLSKWFFMQKNNSYMFGENSIIDGKQKDLKTKDLLEMDKEMYLKYMDHVLKVIIDRKDKLDGEV